MTLYRNLGPITFQCQTQSFQIFSASNDTLILQFKNYQQVNLDEINELLSVYQLILKQDQLLEIYSQKNKPSSIVIHKAIRVGFQKINIQLLCRIIKEMVTSIIHSKKVIPGKIGHINQQMFFQIDGQLRYLYFPIQKSDSKSQMQALQVFQFFNQLKDDKQVSHRLLLKKISKCQTLQEILEETQYFVNIYHAKQIQTLSSYAYTASQQNFFTKTLTKTKGVGKTTNEASMAQFRNSTPISFVAESTNLKAAPRRRYNLFKNVQPQVIKNNTFQQSGGFHSNTWRKPQKQSLTQNATFRVNSRAVHIDSNQKNLKSSSGHLFNRASSVNQSPKKLNNNSKRKYYGMSLHQKNSSAANQAANRAQSRELSRKKQLNRHSQGQQQSNFNESIISKHLQESIGEQRKIDCAEKVKNPDSQWMKQMVHNSLQKWKSKQNEKINLFSKIKDRDRQGSTQVDSRSKFLERNDRPSYDILRQSNISSIPQNHNCSKVQENLKGLAGQAQNYQNHGVGSQRKLKRIVPGNRSFFIDNSKRQSNDVYESQVKNSMEVEFYQNKKESQHYILPKKSNQQSLQQIDLCKSSIEHLAMKNKEEQLKHIKNMQRKKTSIKQLIIEKDKLERNISDQSETQRIQYSKVLNTSKIQKNDKKAQNEQKSLNKQRTSINKQVQSQIKEFISTLTSICQQKQQIDYLGVAVVQTTQHLKSFESIFWQLPMFFLYKKFYQKRLKLFEEISQLLMKIPKNSSSNSHQLKSLQTQSLSLLKQIESQNANIEESLKKLLKTVKKKVKKQYTLKSQLEYIQRYLHLDYTVSYDHAVDEFISMYVNSLLEAKGQFKELVYHLTDILEAIVVYKGNSINSKDREILEKNKQKQSKLARTEAYFQILIKRKQVKETIWPQKQKPKQKSKKSK